MKYSCLVYECQGLFYVSGCRLFEWFVFQIIDYVIWGEDVLVLFSTARVTNAQKHLKEMLQPAVSLQCLQQHNHQPSVGWVVWRRLFPFFFAVLKSSSAALRMNSKPFHAIKCHCKHIRWEMFSFLLHRCTTLSCSLESYGVNLTHSCNIRFKNRTIKLRNTNYTILLPAC